jgi:NADH-quinone oxidoreductase subunit J
MLDMTDFLFYLLALACCASALSVVLLQNPIYSALSLVITMMSMAGLFVTLEAYFIAGVQLIVYAGAVVVLFVIVLMLFDLKHEMKTFSKGMISGALKLGAVGLVLGMLWGTAALFANGGFAPTTSDPIRMMDMTKALATTLYTQYIFAFEALGLLLLIIAIGAVTLSRIAGGTHADRH